MKKLSIENKLSIGLVISLIVIGDLIWKINDDSVSMFNMTKKIEEADSKIENITSEKISLQQQNNEMSQQIYDLNYTASDGTVWSDIDEDELYTEILGFNVKDIESCDKSGWYYYNTLSDLQKEDYRKILKTFITMSSCKEFEIDTKESVQYISQCVLYDHPTLFWIDRFNVYYSNGLTLRSVQDEELAINTKFKIYERWLEIKEYRDSALENINDFQSDFAKEEVIFTYIIRHTKYEKDSYHNQSIYSVVKEKSVCAGYAKMFMYLCNEAGIPCICVRGTYKENGNGHLWNLVRIDGDNYFVDCTNGLTLNDRGMIVINYLYLNCDRAYMEESYSIDDRFLIPDTVVFGG